MGYGHRYHHLRLQLPVTPMSAETDSLEVFALRQVAESLVQTNIALRELSNEVRTVGNEVAALKAQDLKTDVESLLLRVAVLENNHHPETGGTDFLKVLTSYIPWIIALGSFLANFLKKGGH